MLQLVRDHGSAYFLGFPFKKEGGRELPKVRWGGFPGNCATSNLPQLGQHYPLKLTTSLPQHVGALQREEVLEVVWMKKPQQSLRAGPRLGRFDFFFAIAKLTFTLEVALTECIPTTP